MADLDVLNDVTPALTTKHVGYLPSISAMKTAIGASSVAANYPAKVLNSSTKNDLIYICRVEGISVAGL